jgi:hypothetical protein
MTHFTVFPGLFCWFGCVLFSARFGSKLSRGLELKFICKRALRSVVVVRQSQSLKSAFKQNMIGVCIGNKHAKIPCFSEDSSRKGRRVLGRLLENA